MRKNKKVPLIIEPHPDDYKGYEFITLIKYNDSHSLNIIDNVVKKKIMAYVLDLCNPVNIPEEEVIELAEDWHTNYSEDIPISIYFSKMGHTHKMCKILRCFPLDYVTRVIGPLPEFPMTGPMKIRKRKRKHIPANLPFQDKTRKRRGL